MKNKHNIFVILLSFLVSTLAWLSAIPKAYFDASVRAGLFSTNATAAGCAKKYVPEEIQLTQMTPAIVLTTSTTAVNTEIVTYQVPADSEINIRPNDFLGIFLATAAGVEFVAANWNSWITVLMTDAYNRRTQVMAQGTYQQFRSMTDVTLKYFMKAKWTIPAFWFYRIQLLATPVSLNTATWFTQSCQLVYGTIA
jgi:hypothetical protein